MEARITLTTDFIAQERSHIVSAIAAVDHLLNIYQCNDVTTYVAIGK